LSQQEVDENNLDERHLSRIVRKPSQIDGYDYQEADWKEAREKGKKSGSWIQTRYPECRIRLQTSSRSSRKGKKRSA